LSSKKKHELDHLFHQWLVENMHPYEIVQDSGLAKFIAALEPRYSLPATPQLCQMTPELMLCMEKLV